MRDDRKGTESHAIVHNEPAAEVIEPLDKTLFGAIDGPLPSQKVRAHLGSEIARYIDNPSTI